MEIKINMLDVKDGDAIIVELFKHDKTLVMVIDGGEPCYYETKLKPKLKPILEQHKKKAPDIVICTHYDSDHIGGLICLIKEYISDIREVWIHKTPVLFQGYIEKAIHILDGKAKYVSTNLDSLSFQKLFEGYGQSRSLLDKKANVLLESLSQLKRLIDLIPHDKLKQVYYKQRPIDDWQEVVVLGPTIEYFDQLFPTNKSFNEFIIEEATAILPSGRERRLMLERSGIGPCGRLKDDSSTKLTSTNKASIIVAIDDENKRYLFSGDAGIESFKAIPKWESELKELYFLKVPHHGSDNNISKELIELMEPAYVYNSGCDYQDNDVLECFRGKTRNIEVRTTKLEGDLYFDK